MRTRKDGYFLAPVFAILALCPLLLAADAPATPFYYATATPLDRQIVTLVVGVNDSIGQSVVSGDRKSVTLNIDPGMMDSAQIRDFNYQRGGRGFVGSAAPPAQATGRNNLTPSIAVSPGEIAPAASVLDQPGMTLIAPLER